MSAIEEFIGQDILGTFVVSEDEFPTACERLFPRFPRLRLAKADDDVSVPELPEWIRVNMDVAGCDPDALRCLAVEMETRRGPQVNPRDEYDVLVFRAHERRLEGVAPKLIGRQYRQQARKEELQRATDDLHELEQQGQELHSACADLDVQLQSLTAFLGLLGEPIERLNRETDNVRDQAREVVHLEEGMRAKREHVAALNRESARVTERLEEVRGMIAKEGLDKLGEKIAVCQRKIEKLRQQETDLNRQVGKVENQIVGLNDRIVRLEQQLTDTDTDLERLDALLREQDPELQDVEDYVLNVCDGSRLRSQSAVDEARAVNARAEGEHVGELRERLKHPVLGPAFALNYESDANQLMDRRSRTIRELVDFHRDAIAEQKEVINERTHELFRKIIMEGILTYLKTHVLRLEDMIKRTNQLLADREFGRNQYRFQLKEMPGFRRLLEIVRAFNPFETKGEEDLRLFFQDHKDEIFSTEVNQIPDILDYRNWFHYDMRVHRLDSDGVVMDRRTKSVGSGGEQAVPNYLLILTVAHFLFSGNEIRFRSLIMDEAFYGIDAGRRDQLLGFASDLGLQLFVASPDQDGVKQEIAYSTTVLIVKDERHDVHLYPYYWENPESILQPELLPEYQKKPMPVAFEEEL